MAELKKRVMHHLLQKLLHWTILFIIISMSPLLVFFYLLCWIRAKLTALVYSITGHSLMSGNDAVAGMEFNSNNCILNSIIIMNNLLSVKHMKGLLLRRIIDAKDCNNNPSFPKMTCCMTIRAGYFMWHENSTFNIDDHVKQFYGLIPRDEAELKSVINHLCNIPLELSKPGWEIIVIPIECNHTDFPQTAILWRLHHCICDGISIVRLMNEVGGNSPLCINTKRTEHKSDFKLNLVAVLDLLKQFIHTIIATPAVIYKPVSTQNWYHHHNTKLSGRYVYDWTSTIKMSTIKDIKSATSTTVNDVLVSCLAGACRKYLLRQGVLTPNFLESRLPMSYRHPDDPFQLNNENVGVAFKIPTGDMDCMQRLKATKSIMDQVKSSPGFLVTRWFVKHCVNTLPKSIMDLLYDSSGYDVIFSNITGPIDIALFNEHVIDSCFLLPQTRSPCNFGLNAISYAGNLTVGLTVDTAIISTKEEARLVLDDYVEEVHQLYGYLFSAQSSVNVKKLA